MIRRALLPSSNGLMVSRCSNIDHLGNLTSRGISVGAERTVRVSTEDAVGVCGLNVIVEGGAYRHVGEALVACAHILKPCCFNSDLGYLASGHVGIRAEGAIRISPDKPTSLSGFDIDVEGVVARYVSEALLASFV